MAAPFKAKATQLDGKKINNMVEFHLKKGFQATTICAQIRKRVAKS